MHLTLRYGRHGLDVDLPDRNVAHVLRLNPVPPLPDPVAATRAVLRDPLGTPPLVDLARGRRDACLVVSDITRPVPNAVLLPPILDALETAGLGPERILVLVATGLHRGNSRDELVQMGLGDALARGISIVNHDARDAASHRHLGVTSGGIPVWVDQRYLQADLKLLTGLVEPHLMAGFSGGRKAICPGLCGVETVMAWHSPRMLEPPEACAGKLAGNPVHEQALEVARMAGGADLIVNATLDERRQVTGVYAGELEAAHLAAVAQAERQTRVVLDAPVDIVVTTAAGWPLDLTFYQGVKGMVGALPITRPGGTIIIAQENAEGIGGPEYAELMLGITDPHDYMARAFRGEVCSIDQWQLHEQEKVLRRCQVLNFSEGLPRDVQQRLFVTPVDSVEAGVAQALAKHGPDARIAVIPEGPYVLACLREVDDGR